MVDDGCRDRRQVVRLIRARSPCGWRRRVNTGGRALFDPCKVSVQGVAAAAREHRGTGRALFVKLSIVRA